MINRKLPDLISHAADLKHLANILLDQSIVAVDTESNSLYAYKEQVCLIQFSTHEDTYLVDPLAFKHLDLLAPLFSDPQIEKVFHAAEYDLFCLRRDFGFEFANLFDTMIAARILGREAVGLGSILEAEYGIQLDKRYQRSNWGLRPLPEQQLHYARMDTHYLIPLRRRLYEELQKRQLWPLAHEDFERLAHQHWEENGRNGEKTLDCWRIRGSHDLKPKQAAVLHALCKYRNEVARSLNRPLFKVMGDQTLIAIAENTPRTLEALSQLPGMSRGQVRRHGNQLLQAVKRGLRSKGLYPPRQPRPDERYTERVDALKRWRKNTAQQMGVKSDIILPRDLVHSLAEHDPCCLQELNQFMHAVPWRFEHFGDQILETLKHRKET
jgi:ribonuclease D